MRRIFSFFLERKKQRTFEKRTRVYGCVFQKVIFVFLRKIRKNTKSVGARYKWKIENGKWKVESVGLIYDTILKATAKPTVEKSLPSFLPESG